MVAEHRLYIGAVAVSVALHVALSGWASGVERRVAVPAPRPPRVVLSVSVRSAPPAVKRPMRPAMVPAPVPVVPVARPKREPLPPLPTRLEPIRTTDVEKSPKKAARKRRAGKARRKRARRPGRTATSRGGRPSSVPSGSGAPVDLGDWDPAPRSQEEGKGPIGPTGPTERRTPRTASAAGAGSRQDARKGPARLVPPKPSRRPVGRWPAGAPRSGGPVDVVLALSVGKTGKVTTVRVVRSAGRDFDAAARRLARSIRFQPATRGGQPVALTIPWAVTFK